MIDHNTTTLYLLKADDNEAFGPVSFAQLSAWADAAQISPLDKVSSDNHTWLKAPMVPELGMDWLIELSSEQLYGPTTLGAIQEFLNIGEVNGDTILVNARDGSTARIHEMPGLTLPVEEATEEGAPPEPVRTGIRASLQQRIRELEQTLFDERRALENLQERYGKLEEKYIEMVKQRP